MTTIARRIPSRNMVVVRGGDESLHPYWLKGAAERHWDLHVSYFGSKGAPADAETGLFTWSADGGKSKFPGLFACFEKKPFDLDDYDFIALPDDDLFLDAATWNTAFDLARKHNLAVSQLSLDPRSFYSHGLTIRRPGFILRFVNVVEFMPPILRRDAFDRALPLMPHPHNSWGLEYVICKPYQNDPRSIAVLDAACALHTRAHGVSEMYKHFMSSGKTMDETEAEFLAANGAEKIQRFAHAAIDMSGAEVHDVRRLNRPVIRARLTNIFWKMRKIQRIPIPHHAPS